MRVRTALLGGGFGAKLYIKLEALVAVCALLVRRPVRIALTMDEQFYTITKHGATVRIKTGVTNDGRMIAREVETYWNGGAYADIGPRVTQKSGFTAAGPYDIEHVALDNYAVYTNEPPAGALRGFGISQLVWAYERQADIIARTLGIDPIEFRRRNVLREGRPHATGTIVSDMEIDARARPAGASAWTGDRPFDRGIRHHPPRPRRGDWPEGVHLADDVGGDGAPVYGDGSCALQCGTVDMGQASDTAMAQIVGGGAGHPDRLGARRPPRHRCRRRTTWRRSDRGRRSTWATPCRRLPRTSDAQVLGIAATSLST